MAKNNMKKAETKSAIRWRPFVGMTAAERERMLEDFFGRKLQTRRPERWFKADRMGLTAPAVDVFEEQDDIVVKVELPGIDKDSIEVELTDHMLTIKGEKRKEEHVKEESYYRAERLYGSFLRTLDLPKDVEADKVRAACKNGVLEVRLPKTEEAKAKDIKVKVE